MKFLLSTVAQSLADYLSGFPEFAGVTFYQDPTQQQDVPCMFLQQRHSEIKESIGGRVLRTIRLDLTYLVDYNLPNMQQLYQNAADALDLFLATFPYMDGDKMTLLRTYNREWDIDLDALHYKFELRVWQQQTDGFNPMETLEYFPEVL